MVTETVRREGRSQADGRDTTPAATPGGDVTDVANRPLRTSQGIAFTILAVTIAAILILFRGTAEGAVHKWISTESYNHIFFIIPICLR